MDVSLPNWPHRHEICSTEPLKPFLRPLVAELATGLYFSQSMRGEIVGGISNEQVPEGISQESSLLFLAKYARALTQAVPRLGSVRVLRQWAGCYDLTPDGNPIVGPVDQLDGFLQLSGFLSLIHILTLPTIFRVSIPLVFLSFTALTRRVLRTSHTSLTLHR